MCPSRHDAPAAPAVLPPVAAAANPVRIVTPPDGATYRLLPGALPTVSQKLPLVASSDTLPSDTRLHWFIDGRPLGTSRPDEPFFWPMTRGRHTLSCAAPDHLHPPTVTFTVE
jgi:membrane carboxypeptidase/penicillin-binding protein PbpC